MPYTISPNMNLQIPSVGTQPNPDAALNVNTSLESIDGHDHTPGNGVQLTPDSLDINSDLDINLNNLLDVRSIRFDPQSSPLALPADLGCAYVSGVDLYFNDVNGNQIRLTQGGAIAGAAGSISGLVAPASAAYDSFSESFIWESDVNKPAIMDMGSIIVREPVTNGFGVTIEANSSIAANYTLTMPAALPVTTNALLLTNTSGAQSYLSKGSANEVLRMDSSGTNLAYGAIDGSNSIMANSIVQANIAPGTLTQVSMGAVGQQDTISTGLYTTNSALALVTGQSLSITTTGRPVIVMLTTDGTSNYGSLDVLGTSIVAARYAYLNLRLNGADAANTVIEVTQASDVASFPLGLCFFLAPPAGTHTIELYAGTSGSNLTFSISYAQLVAYEL